MDQTTIEEALKALRGDVAALHAKLDQAAGARWDVRILDTSDERVIDLVMRLLALRNCRSSVLYALPLPMLRQCIRLILTADAGYSHALSILHDAGHLIDRNTFYRFAAKVQQAYEHGLQMVLIGSVGDQAKARPRTKGSAPTVGVSRSLAVLIAKRLAASGSVKLARTLPFELLTDTVAELLAKQGNVVEVRKWLSSKIGQNVHHKQVNDLWIVVHVAVRNLERAAGARNPAHAR